MSVVLTYTPSRAKWELGQWPVTSWDWTLLDA